MSICLHKFEFGKAELWFIWDADLKAIQGHYHSEKLA